MRLQRVSDAERRFLLDGIQQGLRNDGRGCFDYRRITFEVGTIPSAMRSCRLRAGDTDLLVCVKCDITKPTLQRPDMGFVHVAVDCAASVSTSFSEGGGEETGRQLSVLLETLCTNEDIVDRRALCVLPGAFVWSVYIDVLVLTSGGNLLDSVSLALCAALSETILPKVQIEEAVEEGEKTRLLIDERPEVGSPFPLLKLPLCVTVAQIKQRFLFDVTSEEELCADAKLCVVVDGKTGEVVGLHKLGRGLFDLAVLPPMLERCRAAAASLLQQLDRELPMKDSLCKSAA